MSIREVARADFKANLDEDGDPVTIYPPTGDPIPAFGFINRIDATLDPQLGIQVRNVKTSVSISNAYFPTEPDDSWKVETTDSEGNTIASFGIDRRFSRQIGFVTFMMEEFS